MVDIGGIIIGRNNWNCIILSNAPCIAYAIDGNANLIITYKGGRMSRKYGNSDNRETKHTRRREGGEVEQYRCMFGMFFIYDRCCCEAAHNSLSFRKLTVRKLLFLVWISEGMFSGLSSQCWTWIAAVYWKESRLRSVNEGDDRLRARVEFMNWHGLIKQEKIQVSIMLLLWIEKSIS